MIWIVGLAILSFATWLCAAFILRAGHAVRLSLTILFPALVAGGYNWAAYLAQRYPGTEAGWDAIFLIFSFGMGVAAGLSMLPVWFLAEERLGWRAK